MGIYDKLKERSKGLMEKLQPAEQQEQKTPLQQMVARWDDVYSNVESAARHTHLRERVAYLGKAQAALQDLRGIHLHPDEVDAEGFQLYERLLEYQRVLSRDVTDLLRSGDYEGTQQLEKKLREELIVPYKEEMKKAETQCETKSEKTTHDSKTPYIAAGVAGAALAALLLWRRRP